MSPAINHASSPAFGAKTSLNEAGPSGSPALAHLYRSDSTGADSSQGETSSTDQFTDALSDLGDYDGSGNVPAASGNAGNTAASISTASKISPAFAVGHQQQRTVPRPSLAASSSSRLRTPSPASSIEEDLTTPTRQRLISSTSGGSGGFSQGRRARAAPAALDLSPRTAKTATVQRDESGRRDSRYGNMDIGMGRAPAKDGTGRRVVTESQAVTVSPALLFGLVAMC